MKFVYIYETFKGVSKKTNLEQDYYVVKLALVDENKKVLRTSQPLIWLTKEQYDLLISSKN